MAISEKRAPRMASYAATAASVVVVGFLWAAGEQKPRSYTGAMYYNHHSGYGPDLSCQVCHVPEGQNPLTRAVSTEMNCMTSGCHGAFQPNVPEAEAVALLLQSYMGAYPPIEPERRAAHVIALHRVATAQSCESCHTEHTKHHDIVVPEGWQVFDQILRQEQNKTTSATSLRTWLSEQVES